MTMRSMIVDDEAAARSRLARLLSDHEGIAIVGEAQDGLDAVQQIDALRPDLLFLDIEMPGLNGFDVLRALPPAMPLPLVIFVTGYDQHALAAFEANALAYLLKPVEADRLARALDRARRLQIAGRRGVVDVADNEADVELEEEGSTDAEAEESPSPPRDAASAQEAEREKLLRAARAASPVLRQIVCRKRDGLVLLPPEQIHWFEVKDGIVRARTASESYWVNYQLVELEAALPPDLFFRARREVLVNMTKIRTLKPYFKSGFLLIMADAANTEIVVSERQVRPLRERLPGL